MTKSGFTPRKSSPSIGRVKHGSAMVPMNRQVSDCTRYTVVFHLNGQRMRRTFGSLQKAKAETQLVAQQTRPFCLSQQDATGAPFLHAPPIASATSLTRVTLASLERLMTTRMVEGKCLLVTHPSHPNFVLFPLQAFH